MANFSVSAEVKYRRSKFLLTPEIKDSFNVGELVPLSFTEVLPGDSMKGVFKAVIRTSSPFIKPIMDSLFMDVYHFFVPLRLVMSEYDKVFGNPNPSSYTSDTFIDIPTTSAISTISQGSIADHLGLPLGSNVYKGLSVLPFRAFALIYDKWFRDQNNVDEIYINKGSLQGTYEVINNNAFGPNNYFGMCPKVRKQADYFVTCLPNVQKGPGVVLPSALPVYPGTEKLPTKYFNGNVPVVVYPTTGNDFTGSVQNNIYALGAGKVGANGVKSGLTAITAPLLDSSDNSTTFDYSDFTGNRSPNKVTFGNLYADGSVINIGDLRTAFQLQRMLELDARSGSRINEYYLAHFGVSSDDLRVLTPEFLGGGRFDINVSQVPQTSATSGTDALADVAAFSWTNGQTGFNKGFTEHGYLFTVGCVRQIHTYQQGIPRAFFRHKREDFYDPLLAHITEQPVYKSQIYGYAANANDSLTDKVFGYNEAWADYRYQPSEVKGQMRSSATGSLDIWHLADQFASEPTLSQSFVEENSDNIDRVLSVPSSSLDNFIIDGGMEIEAIRVMPTYSIPGLVDHSL